MMTNTPECRLTDAYSQNFCLYLEPGVGSRPPFVPDAPSPKHPLRHPATHPTRWFSQTHHPQPIWAFSTVTGRFTAPTSVLSRLVGQVTKTHPHHSHFACGRVVSDPGARLSPRSFRCTAVWWRGDLPQRPSSQTRKRGTDSRAPTS